MHRIGRTGRSSNKGLATTFINKSNEESVLLDLKHLLIEAKQNVPPFLATLQSETEVFQDLGGNCEKIYLMIFWYILSILQATKVVVIVVDLAIVLHSVQNWKPKATSKSLLLGGKITCLILLLIIEKVPMIVWLKNDLKLIVNCSWFIASNFFLESTSWRQ